MAQIECPKCHAFQARRVKQEGFFQTSIMQKLGFFPWECRFCKATFRLKNRGIRSADSPRKSSHGQTTQTSGERGTRRPEALRPATGTQGLTD
jgi:hypothetical protein